MMPARAERLRARQEMLVLSYVAYVGMWGLSAFHTGRLFGLQERFLNETPLLKDRYRLVWGPAIDRANFGWHDHAAFAVERLDDPSHIALVLRGTNPLAYGNTMLEVGAVYEQRDWPYGRTGDRTPRIAAGVDRALQRVLRMRAEGRVPGAGASLVEFLNARAASSPNGIDVHVTGHSLGGVLASTLALYLTDTQGSEWDPERRATLRATTFAAFSPGNADFASHSHAQLGSRCDRVANSLDLTPRVYADTDLETLAHIYEPEIPSGRIFGAFLARTRRKLARAGISYVQLPAEAPLHGTLSASSQSFIGQTMWQHVYGYVSLLGLDDQIDPKALLWGTVPQSRLSMRVE